MRLVDYKCEDCKEITEILVHSDNGTDIKCGKCGSKKMLKIFAPVGFRKSSEDGGSSVSSSGSSCSSCSGGNCSTCGH